MWIESVSLCGGWSVLATEFAYEDKIRLMQKQYDMTGVDKLNTEKEALYG
jgi:hypothetical protein